MLPIIWMSPWNSYFKDKEVAYLMRETLRRYGKAVVMVADVPAASTYLAMGYTPSKARSKARLKGNNLKNRTARVLDEMGIDSSRVRIIDRENEVQTSPEYIRSLMDIQLLYETNTVFHDAIYQTSKNVLEWTGITTDNAGIEKATEYVLAELAYLHIAPDILWSQEITYVYHKNRDVYEQWIAGKFDGVWKPRLNFTLVEHPLETVGSHGKILFQDRRETIKKRWSVRAVLFPYLDQVYYDANAKQRKWWCVEMIREILRDHEVNLEIIGEVWYGKIADILDRCEADIFISPVWPFDQRKLEVFHTDSYDRTWIFGLVAINSQFANVSFGYLSSQENLRVAVKENDIHHFLAQQLLPKAKYVRVPQLASVEEVLHKVLSDRADITFWDPELIQYVPWLPPKDAFVIKSIVRNSPMVTTDICFALPRWEFALKKVIDEWMKKYIDKFYGWGK